MTIEQRPNNAVALVCDTPTCHIEVLGQNDDEAREDANLMGWSFRDQGKRHICPDCGAGRNTAAIAQFGTDKANIQQAPMAYAKGDAFHDPDTGALVGHVEADTAVGQPMVVLIATEDVVAATPPQQPAPQPDPLPTPPPVEVQIGEDCGCQNADAAGIGHDEGCSRDGIPDGVELPGDEAAEPDEPDEPIDNSIFENIDADDLFGGAGSTWNPSKGKG